MSLITDFSDFLVSNIKFSKLNGVFFAVVDVIFHLQTSSLWDSGTFTMQIHFPSPVGYTLHTREMEDRLSLLPVSPLPTL